MTANLTVKPIFLVSKQPLSAFTHLLRMNFEISVRAGKQVSRNLKEHRQIAEAISQRDPDTAQRATRKLLAKNAADLSEMIKKERRARGETG